MKKPLNPFDYPLTVLRDEQVLVSRTTNGGFVPEAEVNLGILNGS